MVQAFSGGDGTSISTPGGNSGLVERFLLGVEAAGLMMLYEYIAKDVFYLVLSTSLE